jgi:hypothetical protein
LLAFCLPQQLFLEHIPTLFHGLVHDPSFGRSKIEARSFGQDDIDPIVTRDSIYIQVLALGDNLLLE